MKTLVINTYGGSLLLGAKALGCEIIGSYEDTGFGTPIQRANFPGLDIRATRAEWPEDIDLSDTVVIAHPPCSAFSVQNTNSAKRGVDSQAFACTKQVLHYALGHNARALAIESVVGALAGAWNIHQYFADSYGYNIYRVLENGAMFGAQWRDRFWVIYIKKGEAPDNMEFTLTPRWQTVEEVVSGYEDGPSPAGMDVVLERLKQRLRDQAGCNEDDLHQIFNVNPREKVQSIDDRLWKLKFPNDDRWETCKKYVSKYATSVPVLLAPDGVCPVLLGGSWWLLNGRNLSESAYKRLMGFPADYIFPEEGRYRQEMRTYLSKGVMPAIAEWILEHITLHLGWRGQARLHNHDLPDVRSYSLTCEPNHIVDFRIRKKELQHFLAGNEAARPPLRQDDDRALVVPEISLEMECSHCQQPAGTATTCPTCGSVTVLAMPTIPVKLERQRREPRVPREPHTPREYTAAKRSKQEWNSLTVEEALAETLFTRPNSADRYALHESHAYHKMGVTKDDILLDIGAHIGCVASRAALLGATVVSIEAEPENFELLKQNTSTFERVTPIWGAVFGGDKPVVRFHRVRRRDDGGWSTGTHSAFFNTRGDIIEVPRLDLHALLEEYRPTVLKCDIEGSEFSLDWDNLPPQLRSIAIELHTKRETHRPEAKAIVTKLYAQGFKPVNNLNMESNFSAIMAFFSREVA